jgi:D-alanyl-D-alanine carboxypeptidase (penicillin-binding protein 5/6)
MAAPGVARADDAAPAAPPVVRAPAAILVEPATGDVVFDRRAAQPRPIASATKLMTALLALERLPLDRLVTVTPYAATAVESTVGLRAGERLTAADLLRALLLASANEAAETLAVRIGGTERRFVRLMNRRAQQLQLTDTHYATPIGLDRPGNRSSARDLVKLTLILRRSAFFRRVTDLSRATLQTGAQMRVVVNRNRVVQEWAPANGVKTGHTALAGYVLVGSATRRGITVVSAVLGDASEEARDADTLALLRYGLGQYRRVTVLHPGRRVATAAVEGRDQRAALVPARRVRRVIRRGERVVTRVSGLPAELAGPLPAGARVGAVELRWRGRTVDRVPLVTAQAVPEPSMVHEAGKVLGRTLLLLAVAAAALGSLRLVVVIRRRQRRRRRAAREGRVA